jgi:membrane fusion protein, heavy metal efflux system
MLSLRLRPPGHFARFGFALLLICLALYLGYSKAFGHEGHDHGDEKKTEQVSATYPRINTTSNLYQIVAIAKGGQLFVYVDDPATNEPVVGAKLEVTVGEAEPSDATEARVGEYVVTMPPRKAPGSVEVVFAINASKGDDLLVDSFTPAPAAIAAAPQAAGAGERFRGLFPQSLNRTTSFTVAAVAVLVLLLTYLLRGRVRGLAKAAALALIVTGVGVVALLAAPRDPAPQLAQQALSDSPRRLPDGTAFAAKPTQRLLDVRTVAAEEQTVRPALSLIGRVIGDPNRTGIVQSVYGGRVVATEGRIPRIGQRVAKDDVLIEIEPNLPIADRTTILEKIGEIEQLIAVAESRIRRMKPLADRGAVPAGQVNDLETELEGLRARREVVRNSRAGREVLRAPIDGIITSAKITPGQVIQPQDVLVQIVDLKSLWVEALAYGDINLNSAVEASAAAANGQAFPLEFVGSSRALRQHASVVHFAISEPPADLNIGQPVSVLVRSGPPTQGLVLPRDAVVRNANGEQVVWLHVAAERFEPRSVRTLQLDAQRLLVAAGLNQGDKVVVRGADLINQIR